MTEPQPVRVTEAVRITRAAEVVETVRITEYASPPPANGEGLALPSGEPPACGCGLCQSPLHLTATAPARRALPPADTPAAAPNGQDKPCRRWPW